MANDLMNRTKWKVQGIRVVSTTRPETLVLPQIPDALSVLIRARQVASVPNPTLYLLVETADIGQELRRITMSEGDSVSLKIKGGEKLYFGSDSVGAEFELIHEE